MLCSVILHGAANEIYAVKKGYLKIERCSRFTIAYLRTLTMLSPLDTYLATIDNDDQRRAARAALTGVNQKETKWTLLNTFVKNKLDLTQHAAEKEFET